MRRTTTTEAVDRSKGIIEEEIETTITDVSDKATDLVNSVADPATDEGSDANQTPKMDKLIIQIFNELMKQLPM